MSSVEDGCIAWSTNADGTSTEAVARPVVHTVVRDIEIVPREEPADGPAVNG
jgi:hypothetical protein